MSRTVLPNEAQALAAAEMLLRFAAEHAKELPRATVATVCSALDAQAANTWNEQIATDFWCAFNALCELIRPATVDTLTTNFNATPPPKWAFWATDRQPVSLSKRTAGRYLLLLMVLLAVSVVLGFQVSTTTGLSKESEQLILQADELTTQMNQSVDGLIQQGVTSFADAGAQQRPNIATLQAQLKQQSNLLDQVLQKNLMMSKLLIFGIGTSLELGNFKLASNVTEVQEAIRNYETQRRQVASDRLASQVLIGILTTTVLPIVLGIMGACAYVVRLISDQIKDTTFSASSPIRHLVRVALGGLAGVVIGFGGVVTEIGLSSSALAFLAGYAVEPVFSTFDGIAEKFRR